jgi:hypothetical protein
MVFISSDRLNICASILHQQQKRSALLMTTTQNLNYRNILKNAVIDKSTFKSICDFNIQNFPSGGYQKYYRSLNNGTAILCTHEQMNTYMACYSDMHRFKLNKAFAALFEKNLLAGRTIEVVDWGCGQAFASGCLVDYIRQNQLNLHIKGFVLVEPSISALERGRDHLEVLFNGSRMPFITLVNRELDSIHFDMVKIRTSATVVKVHLFSNVLDINTVNLEKLAKTIKNTQVGLNYFICVGPINYGSPRIESFYDFFPNSTLISMAKEMAQTDIFRPSAMRYMKHSISVVQRIFKVVL